MTSPLPERVSNERIIEAPETRLVLDKRMVGKFPVGATTVSVLNVEYWIAQNTGAVTITNFTNGQEGQHLYIQGDGNTTLQQGATIETIAGANLLLANNKAYHFVRLSNVWRQI